MNADTTQKLFKCPDCIYTTKRSYDLKRHQNAKHKTINNEEQNVPFIRQDVPFLRQDVPLLRQDVPFLRQDVPPSNTNDNNNKMHCKKCNKLYLTYKNLINHESKCIGVDNLTCPKCMKSFSSRQHKSRHIKNVKCIARSILHAQIPNIQNIDTVNNIVNNNIDNSITNINNIIINNYGNERMNYLDKDRIIEILLCGYKTIPMIVKYKHFDPNFPENNNIKIDKYNQCHVFNSKWNKIDINLLSSSLIEDNSSQLLQFCDKNKKELNEKIHNEEIKTHIKNKLLMVKTKSDIEKYNTIHTEIKDLIKNTA